MLKLKRNITSLGFDTFHVLIERKPSTAPNSPQTPNHRPSAAPSTAPSSSASPTVRDAAAHSTALSIVAAPASTAAMSVHASESLSSPAVTTTFTSDCQVILAAATAAAQSANGADTSSASLRLHSATDNFHSAAARGQHVACHDSSHGAPGQASCHRKLLLDAEGRDCLADTVHRTPQYRVGEDLAANDRSSSLSKPHLVIPPPAPETPLLPAHPPALLPAPQLVTAEVAVTSAAAAQHQQAVVSFSSKQEQHVAATDTLPCNARLETVEQRRQEQKMWGMVNSTILSDLMKTLGSKSIFHH